MLFPSEYVIKTNLYPFRFIAYPRMQLTDYHAKNFACELTKHCASDSVEKLASVLADAQVDLNPHQGE